MPIKCLIPKTPHVQGLKKVALYSIAKPGKRWPL